jgi:hypothetical protein
MRPQALPAIALWLTSCATAGTPRFATVSERPDGPARAPGVAVDESSELPQPSTSARTDQQLIVLRTPLDSALPKAIVDRFFVAVLHEDEAALKELLLDEASVQFGTQGSRQSARTFWQTRFARLDYDALSGQAVLRERALEIYGADDAARLGSARTLPLPVRPGEVLVRAPIAHTHTGKTRLFGDEIVFLLAPRREAYRISMMLEEFALP